MAETELSQLRRKVRQQAETIRFLEDRNAYITGLLKEVVTMADNRRRLLSELRKETESNDG